MQVKNKTGLQACTDYENPKPDLPQSLLLSTISQNKNLLIPYC